MLARSPWQLPRYGSRDGVLRARGSVLERLLRVEGAPVLVRAWQPGKQRLALRAEAVAPSLLSTPAGDAAPAEPAAPAQVEEALLRVRFALAVDDDLGDLFARFRRDRLVGPLLRRMPTFRPKRRPWPWEALAWAVLEQLIESERAGRIQRRFVGRWGARLGAGRAALRDVPSAAAIAGRAPAEMQSMDLSAGRAVALRRLARDIAAGRCDPGRAGDDRRLLAVPEIGPWTVQCLGLIGRGELDSLPAGDLAYIKLVGHLARLGRRATVEEVEEFYAPYAPYRGFVGALTVVGLHRLLTQPSRLAPICR